MTPAFVPALPTIDEVGVLTRHLFDPRGRADRRAMLVSAIGLLVVQAALAGLFVVVGADLQGTTFTLLNLALLWIGGVVLVKRLHDIGWSGWWILPAVAFWVVGFTVLVLTIGFSVGLAAFEATMKSNALAMGALTLVGMLPPFGGLLWLQACPGATGANRFGPVPGASGFSCGHAATDTVVEAVTA